MSDDRSAPRQPTEPPPANARPTSSGGVSARQARTVLVVAAVFGVVFAVAVHSFRGSPSKEPEPQSATAPSAPEPSFAPKTNNPAVQQPEERSGPPAPSVKPAAPALHSPDVLFARTSPSVVQIVVQDRQGRTVSTGSGFVVHTRLLIATNYHVIEKAHAAHVVLPNKVKVAALGVAAFDKAADIAILGIAEPVNVQPLGLARELPAVGVRVYAIGNPLGLANTLSDGLVSGHRQLAPTTVIQTTAPISPGSSGGPLLVANGSVVGVTTAGMREGQNLNFAVPASHVARLLRQWENNKRLTQFPLAPQPDVSLFAPSDFPNQIPPQPGRTKARDSRDDGKFFSEAVFKKVAPAADKLLKEKGTDFFVETVMAPWKDADKIKGTRPDESDKFFRELVEERGKEVRLKGVYILVCKNPSCLHVLVSDPAEFPPGYGTKVVSALAESFQEKKFDEGLQKAIDITLEAKGLGKKW